MKSKKSHKKNEDANNLSGFFAGLLLGGLAGAAAMLFLAPQSGEKTRRQIRRKGKDLREQATGVVDDTAAQVRTTAHQVTTSIHEQADTLQQQGQDVIDEGKERFATVVEAGKAAVNGS
ncbi:MAG: YtxH domain-containing protein [Anaerolineae bacterium]|nr:YtxH domain-containing protein [Anaerolineae bacterium]